MTLIRPPRQGLDHACRVIYAESAGDGGSPMVRSCLLRAVGVGLILAGCTGGRSPTTPEPSPASTPPPAPAPTPTPNTSCGLAPGPVVRYAVRPREHRENNRKVEMLVRARPGWDEVWCIDKDSAHQLDFDSNQRNADRRECCWVYDPQWTITDLTASWPVRECPWTT